MLFSFAIGAVVAVGRLVAAGRLRLRRFAAGLGFGVVRLALLVGIAKRLVALIAGAAACASVFVVISSAWHKN